MTAPSIPTSGSVITKADIQAMHQAVRAGLNAVGAPQLGRECFDAAHLPSLISGWKYVVGGAAVLNTYPAAFSDSSGANIQTQWQALAGYSGTGAAMAASYVIIWANIRCSHWVNAMANHHHQAWFNLWYAKDGIITYLPENSGHFYGPQVQFATSQTVEKFVTIVRVLDWSDGIHTLNTFGVKGALCRGTDAAAPDLHIEHGNLGYVGIAAV